MCLSDCKLEIIRRNCQRVHELYFLHTQHVFCHYFTDSHSPPGASAANADDGKDSDNLQQTAYICTVCKFMSLTQADMKSHIREKHKSKLETVEATARVNGKHT